MNSLDEPDASTVLFGLRRRRGLQADHLPSAWERKAAGKPLRLADVDVVCGACNRKRGSAAQEAPGDMPPGMGKAPAAKAKFVTEIA